MSYDPETRAPENAGITIRNVPVDIQNEDRFAPVGGFAFSPLAQELASVDNGILALLLVAMYKRNPGRFMALAEKYMNNITGLLGKIIESGKAHPLSSLNAATLFACVAHRFGIINDQHYLKMADQTRAIIDKIIQLNAADIATSGILSGLETFVEGTTESTVMNRYGTTTKRSGLAVLAGNKK